MKSGQEHLHDRGTDRFLADIKDVKPIHPADARTLRHLRTMALAELTAICRGPAFPPNYAAVRRVNRLSRRAASLTRLLVAAGVAAAFALAAFIGAAPTPIDSSLLPGGDLPGVHGRTPTSTRPGVRDDAWAGFLSTT